MEKIEYKYLLCQKRNGHYLESEAIGKNLKRKYLDKIKRIKDDYINLHKEKSQMIFVTGFRADKEKIPIIQIERSPLLNNQDEAGLGRNSIPILGLMKVD